MPQGKYRAVVFDLYTALLDSWSLWNEAAGSEALGLAWRKQYLALTYQAGAYRSYEGIIAEAAQSVGLASTCVEALIGRWSVLQPWPEARQVLHELSQRVPLAVATNSSETLARIAVARLDTPFSVVATAEESGFYKPKPPTYRLALERLGVAAAEALFVAGSASDVPGALSVGMSVYWHNRARLSQPDGATRPLYEDHSLLPLLNLV